MGSQRKLILQQFFQKWLKYNDIEMYSIHNERKPDAAEIFIRTLKKLKSTNT